MRTQSPDAPQRQRVKKARKIKLLLVDDHPIVLDGIKSHLSAQEEFLVVGDAANGDEAIRQARLLHPDIVLMDISMPYMNGLEAVTILRRKVPKAKILVLTMHDNREYISQIVRSGARGYVLKDTSPAELVRAIKMVHNGEVFFSPAVSRVVLEELIAGGQKKSGPTGVGNLSEREREVLELIAEGYSNKEIANRLGVGVRTIETHRERIMRKLNIHSVAGLTKFAIAKGMIKIE
jgi:two-component system nitrate/nitrite response regulator NarL